MSANNYKDYIELLRSREARPSFERTKAILESRQNESGGLFASSRMVRKFAIGIAGLALISLTAKMYVYDSQTQPNAAKTVPVSTSITQSSQVVTHSENPTSTSSLRGVPEGRTRVIQGSNSLRVSRIIEDRPVITSRLLAMTNSMDQVSANSINGISSTEKDQSVPFITPVPPRTDKIDCDATNDIHMPLSPIITPGAEGNSAHHLYLSLSGSLSQALVSGPSNSRYSFDGFLGGGYNISSNFAIGIAGGRESFMIKQPTYSIGFTDKIFVHNGKPIPSIIGNIVTVMLPQPTQINSFGANLRYSFEGNPSSLYAELFGGGSLEGMIGGITIGGSVYTFGDLSLDAGAFIRSLFSSNSAAITKWGASLLLKYDL